MKKLILQNRKNPSIPQILKKRAQRGGNNKQAKIITQNKK